MKQSAVLFFISAFSLVLLGLAPFVGMENIPLESILESAAGDIKVEIFWKMRVPRVILAFCAGSALAVSGMAFQAIFRNPLATPFTLGVSSGAAFGATFYIRAGILIALPALSGQALFAFCGAILSILIVYGLTRAARGFSTATMLLAGVAVNFFFASLILFSQYMSDFTHSFRIIRWLMGEISTVGFKPVFTILPFVTVGSAVVFFYTHELNLMTLGEDIAISRGVNVGRIKTALFFATSLMVGSVVSMCGPIGFIGMMSPHICRLLIGPDHRWLTPATFIFGGLFLTLCDTLARTLIAPAEIPVGVITALLGGPFFLWLLLGGSAERSLMKEFG
ncbi:MAG: iron ABC transporter permease [Gemmatimonadota bacterium]|nr:iron ABC transporter permease [Gemmatimonadota bacterium]